MKRLLIQTDERMIEVHVNHIDKMVVINELLDDELMTTTLSFQEFSSIYTLVKTPITAVS